MIYLVEDDNNIRELVEYTLCSVGLETKGFDTPSAFWSQLGKELPSLVLLDIMLPEESGLDILEKLKGDENTSDIPVILLTAKGTEMDKVRGFEAGADDYIPKPFGMMELVARVKARMRKTDAPCKDSSEYKIGSLYLCRSKHVVKVDGQSVILTLKEFEMLWLLLENINIVLDRDTILNKIWGYSFDGESRTVDVHIRTLRQKLGSAGNLIETVRGIGYKISGGSDE